MLGKIAVLDHARQPHHTQLEGARLTEKESRLRQYILDNRILFVVLKIGLPIALFQGLNHLFRIFDTFLAARIDATAASLVAYFSQINFVLASIGSGLAIGFGLKVGLAYGAGDYDFVKRQVSSTVALTVTAALALAAILLPIINPVLLAIGTPPEFIHLGANYLRLELISTLLTYLNLMYIAMERAQGNSRRILGINLTAMFIKFGLTTIGVFAFDVGITFFAIATLLSQVVVAIIAIRSLFGKSEVFRFSPRFVSFSRAVLWPIVAISLPIIASQAVFNIGKVIVNTMLVSYGPIVIGAAGITGLLVGLVTTVQMGMRDGAISVMTQNLGADQIQRTFGGFRALMAINLVVALILFIPLEAFGTQITGLFANNDPEFHHTLLDIHRFMIWNAWPFVWQTAAFSLFLTFEHTKITLLLDTFTLFVVRIPLLWALIRFTNIGSEVAGLVMSVSNFAVLIPTAFLLVHLVRGIVRDRGISTRECLIGTWRFSPLVTKIPVG
ncbi:MAG: MATE family efflux transporter [Promicromonosporaceae bacterium]|nr:MATE family efflux transporter [Promicromonosporaceae bacterium]